MLLALEAGEEPFDEACSRLWWDLAAHFGPKYPIPMACLSTTVELRGEMDVSYELAPARRPRPAAVHRPIAASSTFRSNCCRRRCAQPTPLEGVEPVNAPHAGVLVFL